MEKFSKMLELVRALREEKDGSSEALDKVAKLLTTVGRKHVAPENFVFPEEKKYPIHDIAHARNALARVSQYGSPEEISKVRSKVYTKYPSLKPESKTASMADLLDPGNIYDTLSDSQKKEIERKLQEYRNNNKRLLIVKDLGDDPSFANTIYHFPYPREDKKPESKTAALKDLVNRAKELYTGSKSMQMLDDAIYTKGLLKKIKDKGALGSLDDVARYEQHIKNMEQDAFKELQKSLSLRLGTLGAAGGLATGAITGLYDDMNEES